MSVFELRNVKNAWVVNCSVILKNFRPLRETIIDPGIYRKYESPKFLLKYLFPIIRFSGKNHPHILFTNEWSPSYYHWIYESLPRLVFLLKHQPNALLILPKRYLKIEFIVKSLQALQIDLARIVTLPGKSHLKVKNLFYTPYHDKIASFEELRHIKNILISNVKNAEEINLGERIYISRNNPKLKVIRNIVNEDEVLNLLRKYGFKTVFMEDYNFADQISISKNAKYIIAPHGAGISNAFFMREDGNILELSNIKRGFTCFEAISKILNLNHVRQDCRGQNHNQTAHLDNVIVDINLLEENIQSMLKN